MNRTSRISLAAILLGPLLLSVGTAAAQTSARKAGTGARATAAARPAAGHRPRAIVIGWDAADWKLLDPLMQQGKLPNLSALVAKGRSWNLDSFQPMASPIIWTTLATGRTPVDHGVADFQEYDPKNRVRLPISSRSRRVPAIWNVASQKGVSVGVVGWWATWPAEKVKGFLISDRASPVLFDAETLSRSPALTWPEGLAEGVRLVGRREGTPGYDEIARALNVTRAEFDQAVAEKKELLHPITGYQKILGSTRVYARTALDLYERDKPELLMVYFEGTDEIGHLLARYHPPKLPATSDDDFRKYSGGVVAFYVEADRVLGEFMKKAERDDATLFLMSDHGFKWGDKRPGFYSSIQFDTAFLWHESPGVLAAMGPAVTASSERGTASVFDVTPTLCRVLGLPGDPAFEGKLVTGVDTRKVPAAARAVSWSKTVPVERLVVTENPGDKKAAEEFTKKLVSLGYLTGSEASAVDARPPDRAGTETAGTLQNIGTFLRGRGKTKESIVWYRRALEVNPKSATAWMNLSIALMTDKKWEESDETLLAAVRNGYNDPEAAMYRRVATYMREGSTNPAARKQLSVFLRKLVAQFPENDKYRSSLGKILFEDRDCAGAEKVFRALVAKKPADTESLNLLALSTWCLGKIAESREFFQRSLKIDPNQEIVNRGLAQLDQGGSLSQ
ncbi:MAG: alkaline phosphatase family protein [Thermoanaerobaculia bacterium]